MPANQKRSHLGAELRAGYRTNPIGLPTARGVMLSWAVSDRVALDRSAGYTVRVWDPDDKTPPWQATTRGNTIPYAGSPIGSRVRRCWTVSAFTPEGVELVSDPATFDSGLESESEWSATWISAPSLTFRRETWDPVPLLRKVVRVQQRPTRARLYVTALGVYRLWLNGVDITAGALLRPGWTDYRQRVLHQTFDVTAHIRSDHNVIAVELAKGWYAGRVGLQRQPGLYGDQPALRVQLEDDGNLIAVSDGTWRYSYGDIMASDLLCGETHDLRQGQDGWTQTTFDDSTWDTVQERRTLDVHITPQLHHSITPFMEFPGHLVREHARGPAVFDFGQNIVGWTRLTTRTLPKADVIVRHGEILTPDDLVWRDNLRGAFQEERYTTGDSDLHVLEPRHTQHGFRYAEVWGMSPQVIDGALKLRDDTTITAIALSGGQPVAGSFECSSPELNRVAELVTWTVRDNSLEVITDCPQRDERLGWLGDAGVIAASAAYLFDLGAFLPKFARDAADAQHDDGAVPSYVPLVPPANPDGAPGWADGYVRLVHLAASRYGDLVTAAEHYSHLVRYLALVDAANPSGIRTERVGADFSDWLSLPEDAHEPPHPKYEYTGARSTSSRRVIATAHTIRSYDQLADIARLLDRQSDAERFNARATDIRLAYAKNFLDASGRIESDTQTVYAQAVGYEILRGPARAKAVARLAEKVRALGHLTTGIHGVEHIIPVLARNGHLDVAESLLFRQDMPSWNHMVRMGATTVWEKWDGISANGSMSTAEMNSFNHCALGAVGEFLFEGVAGLNARAVATAQTVVIAPVYLDRLDWARANYRSVGGTVLSSWERTEGMIRHSVHLAPGLRADYRIMPGYRIVGSDSDSLSLDSGHSEVLLERIG